MIKRDGKWHWTCKDCGCGAKIPLDCDRVVLVGKSISCPGCRSVFTISPSLEVLSCRKTARYLVTGKLDKSEGRYLMPDGKRLAEIAARVAGLVVGSGGHVEQERVDIRSVIAILSESAAYALSKDPGVCAVLPVGRHRA